MNKDTALTNCPWDFLRDGRRHIISIVGGGGKTTIMYQLARYFARQGMDTAVMTTTHIWQPNSDDYAENMQQAQALWSGGRFAVLGEKEPGTGKLLPPQTALQEELLAKAEIILIEADGAKQLPCKIPAAHEPVLLPQSDIVIGTAGADALHKPLGECCFRWQAGEPVLGCGCDMLLDIDKLASLLLHEQGTRKGAEKREYYIALNKCELITDQEAQAFKELLIKKGMAAEHIWLRRLTE